jgi:hypothetical protein
MLREVREESTTEMKRKMNSREGSTERAAQRGTTHRGQHSEGRTETAAQTVAAERVILQLMLLRVMVCYLGHEFGDGLAEVGGEARVEARRGSLGGETHLRRKI